MHIARVRKIEDVLQQFFGRSMVVVSDGDMQLGIIEMVRSPGRLSITYSDDSCARIVNISSLARELECLMQDVTARA